VICVLGDAHLDVVVCPEEPIAEETDTPSRTWVGAGGQAANVAAWICALGGQARLVAARGTDLAADLVAADLVRRGVRMAGPVIEGGTGVVVSLSDHGASRSMLTWTWWSAPGGRSRRKPTHRPAPGSGPAARRPTWPPGSARSAARPG